MLILLKPYWVIFIYGSWSYVPVHVHCSRFLPRYQIQKTWFRWTTIQAQVSNILNFCRQVAWYSNICISEYCYGGQNLLISEGLNIDLISSSIAWGLLLLIGKRIVVGAATVSAMVDDPYISELLLILLSLISFSLYRSDISLVDSSWCSK